jgi:hypothetical protein
MKYPRYYHEKPSGSVAKTLTSYNRAQHKINVWNTFFDSDLSDVTDDDFSIVPRVLPLSYLKTIRRSSLLVTEFCLKLLSLPERELRAIIPSGPVADHLLNELQVLKYRTGRIIGSFRFDMAIVGEPDDDHPPFLLEINEIGFDGLARSSYFQKVLLELMPELRGRLRSLDTAAAEVKNMRRLGNRIARLQYDSYNWDEEYLLKTAQRLKTDIRLICPTQFGLEEDTESFPMLQHKAMRFSKGRAWVGDWKPDAINMSFAYGLDDYQKGHALYSKMMRAKTPQYGPFLTGLVAAKTILVLLSDAVLRRKLMGSAKARELGEMILPAQLLSSSEAAMALHTPGDWVIKHTDGFGGKQVFMDRELEKCVRNVKPRNRHEWVLQRKTKLNLIDVNGILSKPKQAIADLGVFVEYDWSRGKFSHFEVGGLMSRATNKSLKVNVSSGGLQAAVLLDRSL